MSVADALADAITGAGPAEDPNAITIKVTRLGLVLCCIEWFDVALCCFVLGGLGEAMQEA